MPEMRVHIHGYAEVAALIHLGLPSSSTQSSCSGRKDLWAVLVKEKGDLRITVRNVPPGQPLRNDSQPRSTPVPFFLEIHEELAKTWKALYTTQSCLRSSLLITLNSGVAKGYISIP